MNQRVTYSGANDHRAGCDECHGKGMAHWYARNAVGVAARHHDATGHTTWAEYVVSVRYGERDDREEFSGI